MTLYSHFKTFHGIRGTICVSSIEGTMGEGDTLNFGVSFTDPKDQFNKQIGRTIAEGRSLKKPYKTKILSIENSKNKKYILLAYVFPEIESIVKDSSYRLRLASFYRKNKNFNKLTFFNA